VSQRYLFTTIISINRVNFTKMKKFHYHVLGVMSGTSLDGVDVAELLFKYSNSGDWKFTIVHTETIPYSEDWKNTLRHAITLHNTELVALNKVYTDYLAKVLLTFISKHHITKLDAVCSHGHTILHQPEKGLTLQIGNLPELAELIQQVVVCDFRVQDVLFGGQGAPLVPIGDRLLFKEYEYCLNLGGFANVSYEGGTVRTAFDICPVNIVLNKYAEMLGYSYDDEGKFAVSGALKNSLLEQLNAIEYYHQKPPKSLGVEWVQQHMSPILKMNNISAEDILRTFVEHIAIQIAKIIPEGSTVLVTGGGAYNNYLMSRIRQCGKFNVIIPSTELIEFKEALIFGLLGVLKLRNESNCLASVTGAKNDHSSGKIFFP